MSSRKEEKERLRRERLAAEKAASSSDRKRLIIGYVVAGVLVAAVVVGIVFAISGGGGDDGGGDSSAKGPNVNTSFGGIVPDGIQVDNREGTPPPPVEIGELEAAAKAAGCQYQANLRDEGATHLNPKKDDLPDYKTNPPTSGDHYPVPLADGAFLDLPSPGNYVHNLEHGRIQIQYRPDIPEEQQLILKGIFDENRPGMVLFPNPDLDSDLAVVAWTQLLTCDEVKDDGTTADAIRAFRNTFLGRGPEPIPY
jgi:hypothetical protein